MIEKSSSASFALATIAILGQPPGFSVVKAWRDLITWMVIIYYPLMERVIFLLHKCIVNNAARNITVTAG